MNGSKLNLFLCKPYNKCSNINEDEDNKDDDGLLLELILSDIILSKSVIALIVDE